MNSFTFTQATAVASAVQDKAAHEDSAYIGGGTNLIDLMKENVARPTHLIGLKKVGLDAIEALPDGGLRLGALATNADTAWHPEVEKRYPLLNQAILAGASPQLRNMATDGGNLMQRTRCYYFYDLATPCNKREPGSGCSAIGGYNRVCGILGTSDSCIATYPSDMCIALAALATTVRVSGPNGERTIQFEDFHRLPGDHPERDNTMEPSELITSLDLPEKGFSKNFSYLKLRDRSSYAFALVSVAAALELDGNTIKEARLALGGVAHKPWRNKEAEAMLVGQPATTDASQEQTDVVSFATLEPAADGFRNYLKTHHRAAAEELLIDKAQLLTLTAPELTVLFGGLRAINIIFDGSKNGVFTSQADALTNDYFLNLLDLNTTWASTSDAQNAFQGRDRKTNATKWTGTRVDLIFGSNSELRALAEVYACEDSKDKFVKDFVAVWAKVMNLDRFVLAKA